MLTIGKIAAGPAAGRYYTDQVARGRDDYYAGEGEAPGRWVGGGAAALGWEGEVDADQFMALLAGGGLRTAPRAGGVAGFDLTFRAPKSVSVLWGVADADVVRELRAAHDAAVVAAMGYIEREACRARRGAGGVIEVTGGGFVAAAFVHRSSREGDPLLHTHVVVGNLTQGPDKRWTALYGRRIYRHAKTAGYVYQAELRREIMERLGLEWGPVENGVADLAGVSRDVVEHFSRRRAQILEHMQAHGGRSAASAQVAALETRRAKSAAPVDRLRADWSVRAAEHGLTRDAVQGLRGRAVALQASLPADLLQRLTEHASTFGQPELMQALAEAQPRGARLDDLDAIAEQVLASPQLIRLPDAPGRTGAIEARYTTQELLQVERELLAGAARRRSAHVTAVQPAIVERVVAESATLSEEQRAVVRKLCSGGDGVAVLRAAAGTGKTFVLDAAREAWQGEGHPVIGCALSARAAHELQDQAGIPSVTVAAARRSIEEGRELPHDGVLVVDEAGMVGTRDLAALAAAAERARAKLVLVGDDRQLPEISAGGAFHALAERLETLELREVRRQSQPWDRAALDALRNGDIERWARAYRDHGRITVADNTHDARAALVNDWSRAGGDAVMIAARRADVTDLNERARELLQAQGRLSGDALTTGGRAFAPGDRVVGLRNDRDRGILNGQRGTVCAIDRDRQTLTVDLDSGRQVTLDHGYLAAGHLDHAYAITAHRAQGATVDRAFVLGSEDLYREWGYTALSRHRDEARFYVARPDLEIDPDHPNQDPLVLGLEHLLSRSGAKELALDSLTDTEADALAAERDQLRNSFKTGFPTQMHVRQLAAEVLQARHALDSTDARIARLQVQHDATSFLRFGERCRLRALINQARVQREPQAARLDHATAAHSAAATELDRWITLHGPDAARLIAIDRELSGRGRADQLATRRLGTLERTSEWPARAQRERARNHGIDRGP